MLKKIIFIISIFCLVSNCGYAPMYSKTTNANFSITSIEIEGNTQMNNIIKTKLKKYINDTHDKKFYLKIETSSNKFSAAKDITGKTTDLKLIADLNLTYIKQNSENKNEEKNILFSESLTLKRNDNNYEQNNYEKTLIQNMSETLINKLIFYLSRLK